jgi:proline dehydrogenase
VRARPLTGPPRLLDRLLAGPLDRFTAGPDDDDALRVAAAVSAAGRLVALERAPGADSAELTSLADRLADRELTGRVELAADASALGAAAAATVRQLGASGVGVALTGRAAAVDGLVAAQLAGLEPPARVVVRADEPGAEERCRVFADGAVRLLDAGPRAELAFVRCLNVLMAGTGSPAVATTDPRLLAITGERAAWNERPHESWEHVMPYGVRTDEQQRLTAAGFRVRVVVPWGPGAPAAAVRRLAGRS